LLPSYYAVNIGHIPLSSSSVCFSPGLCVQRPIPLNDPDLNEMLRQAEKMQKEAGELQKQNPTSLM